MKKGMKKFVSLLLAAMMVVSMVAFSTVVYADANPDFKMGVILVGDETEGYSAAHIEGIKKAAGELGL